ncbi:MAG: carboxypeptidase regulatory-like domain-containing protein [Pyrinomonadaceae bacterium]
MFRSITKRVGVLSALALLAAIFTASTNAVIAQSSSGTIRGTVTDSAGAVVAGANVEVVNNNNGEKRSAVTNEQGGYTVPNLSVGEYTVNVSAVGFALGKAERVAVSVSFTTDADLSLNPAGATETVVVTSGDTQTTVNTNDQQLSTLIDNRKILDLPLLSRDPNALILLSPNTTTSSGSLNGFIVNGQSERNNNFQVDGIDNNDADVPGGRGGASTPNIDATQEFRVITSSFSAEFGRNAGAVINVATKSGTNEYHGNAYIYYRSDRFAARDFFDVSGQADPLQRRQYGGSLGGPIKRDKLFFFVNYERDIFDQGLQATRTVPSALARQGIFDTGGLFGRLVFAPNSANNRSSVALQNIGYPAGTPNLGINPAIAQILNVYPLGNSPGEGPLPGVFDTFRFSPVFRSKSDALATRVDYNISDKHNLSGSFNLGDGNFDFQSETFPGLGDGGNAPFRSYLLALNLVSNFTPNFINELRVGGNRIEVVFNGPGDGSVSAGPFDAIRSAFSSNGVPAEVGFGGSNGSIINLFGGTVSPLVAFDTQFRFAGTTNVADSITYIRGAHTFKFGGETRFVYSNSASNFNRQEALDFNLAQFGSNFAFLRDNTGARLSNGTAVGVALNNFATFLSGFAIQQTQSQFYDKDGNRVDQDYRGFRIREFDLFFQDNWKVRSNLTLNLGLRWDYKGVPFEVNGQVSNLINQDASSATPAGGFIYQTVGKNSTNPDQPLYLNDYNNFAPRFGFNYSPSFNDGFLGALTGGPGKTSIRGGYGVFYDRIFSNLFTNTSSNPPFQNQINQFALDVIQNVPRAETIGPVTSVEDGARLGTLIFPLPGNNPFQDKFATPYTQSWNFGVQRQLGNSLLLEADYVGAKGTNLLRQADATLTNVSRVNAITGANNPIDPTDFQGNIDNGTLNTAFDQSRIFLTLGHSTYNAMTLRATKRLGESFFGSANMQAAYTFSHSIDNVVDPLPDRAQAGDRSLPRDSSGFNGGFNAERGSSGFDTRHRFVSNFVYDLPRFENRLLNRVFGDISMSGILTLQSGQPFSIFTGVDTIGTGVSQRASFAESGQGVTPGANAGENLRPSTQIGPSATLVREPEIGEAGNVGRNSFYGHGFKNFDFSFIKRIPLKENVRLRVQADFFNLFNNVNLANPNSALGELSITSPTFGQSSSTRGTPRIIQFAARFEF